MSCNDLNLIQDDRPWIVVQSPTSISLIQQVEVINVCAQNPVTQFTPFYFVATAGQTEFTLPGIALAMPLCAVNGTAQAQAKTPTPDFSFTDNILTINGDLDDGDLVFGIIQTA